MILLYLFARQDRSCLRAVLVGGLIAAIMTWSSEIATAADKISIVVPNDYHYGSADSHDPFPFSTTSHLRYQQVYSASQFSAINQTGGWITRIIFSIARCGTCGSYFEANMPSLQVNLSTTSKVPDGLSDWYAENVGEDETIVVGPAPLDFSADCDEGNPLVLTKPFYYDPRNGNLLLDVFNYFGSIYTGGCLNATAIRGDSVSSVFGNTERPYIVSGGTSGLITFFDIIPGARQPKVTITLSDRAAILRWPLTVTNFVLVASSALNNTNQWETMANASVVIGSENVLTNRIRGSNQFFRLKYTN